MEWDNDIGEFVTKRLSCQQVKLEYQKLGGLAKNIRIPTCKWQDLNIDFIMGLSRTHLQFDSIWVIVARNNGIGSLSSRKDFIFGRDVCQDLYLGNSKITCNFLVHYL